MDLKPHISSLVLASKPNIACVIRAMLFDLSKPFVHLTGYLAFFTRDDVLTTGVLTKQSENVLFTYL